MRERGMRRPEMKLITKNNHLRMSMMMMSCPALWYHWRILLIFQSKHYKDGYTTPSPCSPALNNSPVEPPMLVNSINNPFLEKYEVDDDVLIIHDVDDLCFMDGDPADDHKIEETNVSHLFRKYQNNSINITKTEGLFIESNVYEILSLSSSLKLQRSSDRHTAEKC